MAPRQQEGYGKENTKEDSRISMELSTRVAPLSTFDQFGAKGS